MKNIKIFCRFTVNQPYGVDKANNIYLVCSFYDLPLSFGSINFIPNDYLIGFTNSTIIKCDTEGNFIRSISPPVFVKINQIAIDTNYNILISGNYSGGPDSMDMYIGPDCFISYFNAVVFLKLDSVGSYLWDRGDIGNWLSESYATSVVIDKSGNIYFTGYYNYPPTFGTISVSANSSIFVVKYDPYGNLISTKEFSCNYRLPDFPQMIPSVIDKNNNLLIAGAGFAGTGSRVLINFDSLTFNALHQNIFIAKIDSTGNVKLLSQLIVIIILIYTIL